jgi:hypothetical protein
MNWKLIFTLLLCGLAMALATIFFPANETFVPKTILKRTRLATAIVGALALLTLSGCGNRTVDSAPFNPEIGHQKQASWTPVWTPIGACDVRQSSAVERECTGELLVSRQST